MSEIVNEYNRMVNGEVFNIPKAGELDDMFTLEDKSDFRKFFKAHVNFLRLVQSSFQRRPGLLSKKCLDC